MIGTLVHEARDRPRDRACRALSTPSGKCVEQPQSLHHRRGGVVRSCRLPLSVPSIQTCSTTHSVFAMRKERDLIDVGIEVFAIATGGQLDRLPSWWEDSRAFIVDEMFAVLVQ
jgi:hypothetical protein